MCNILFVAFNARPAPVIAANAAISGLRIKPAMTLIDIFTLIAYNKCGVITQNGTNKCGVITLNGTNKCEAMTQNGTNNVEAINNIKSIPLYAVFCIKP